MNDSGAHAIVHFLGWERPFVRAVADHLMQRSPGMDWSDVTLVLAGGRAGRRLISVLADEAAARGVAMIPPRVVTIGHLPELLYKSERPAAGAFLRQMAWVSALRRTPEEMLRPLFPKLTRGASLGMWQGAARSLEKCAEELAAGGTDFAGVVARAAENNLIRSPERWEAAAAVYAGYLEELDALGVCDRQRVRAEAARADHRDAPGGGNGGRDATVSAGGARTTGADAGKIILAGVTELSQQSRSLLSRLTHGQVEALVLAPADLAEGFDGFGCVLAGYWGARHVDLSGAHWKIAQGVADQARAVFAAIAEAGSNVRTDDVTIGVADEQIVPYLETTAENLRDVPVRFGAGTALNKTRPFQLLQMAAEYLETGDFKEFTALVRHPDLEHWLTTNEAQGEGGGERIWRDWRSLLDGYAGQYLPRQLGEAHREIAGWRSEADAESGNDDRPDLAWLYSNVQRFLGELNGEQSERAGEILKSPDEWAPLVLKVLHRAYGRLWDQKDPAQRRIVMACLGLRDAIEELVEAGESAGRARFEKVPAHEALKVILSLAGGQRIAPPLTGAEIEIVGWLELMPDDAPHLIVSGFSEGNVPEATPPSPLINEVVRQVMGLARDPDRLARDAYLLTAMIESRRSSGGSVTLISGRRSASNDPLLPSRLIFRCEPRELAGRVLRAVEAPKISAALKMKFGAGPASGFMVGAAGRGKDAKIASMRVTAFRDYLRSPQGFYLKNVLKIDTLEDGAARELDARQCGDVVHAVLKDFAGTPAAHSDSRQQCVDMLMELLDAQIGQRFGAAIPGTLKFQVEMIRKRLELVGARQAEWFSQGWRIVETEWGPAVAAGFEVDGSDMGLRGRIDRIDFNERINTFAVLDYKVGAGRRPEETHRKSQQWCDLQLPLYRHLARGLISVGAQVQLGYIAVAEDPANIGHLIAEWDGPMLADADEAARRVVRDVRACKFDEPGDYPPEDGIFAHIFGLGMLNLGGEADSAGEEEVGA